MSDEKLPATKPDEPMPGDTASPNPSSAPKPGEPAGDSKPVDGAPYDKKGDPAQQPS